MQGDVSVPSGATLAFPDASRLVVGGGAGIDVGGSGGTFEVNTGGQPVCSARPGATVTPAAVVVAKGAFTMGSNAGVRLCQTFVEMAAYPSPVQTTATDTPEGPTCSADLPCPATTTSDAGCIQLNGLVVDWTAPNQLPSPPDLSHPYEDLALWTEAGDSSRSKSCPNSQIGSNGITTAEGVFFMPNAQFTFSGNTSVVQGLDAQFAARRLLLTGQGDLTMVPNPLDSTPTPGGSGFSVIR